MSFDRTPSTEREKQLARSNVGGSFDDLAEAFADYRAELEREWRAALCERCASSPTLDDGWRKPPPRIVSSGIEGVSKCSDCGSMFKGEHRCWR